MAKLTTKQQVFVDEYLIDLNATQAAIRAGYSSKTANEQGCQNLAKLSIQEAVAKKMAVRSKRTGVNQDRIILEIAKIAFVNITDIVNVDKATIRGDASREDTAAISAVKVKVIPTDNGDITEREVKTYDKLKALEMIGRHMGMWNDKIDVSVNIPIVISGEDELKD